MALWLIWLSTWKVSNMIMAQDVLSGYGQKPKKPKTTILPYLRAKEAAEKKAQRKTQAQKTIDTHKDEPTKAEPVEESYDEARRKIIAGEE